MSAGAQADPQIRGVVQRAARGSRARTTGTVLTNVAGDRPVRRLAAGDRQLHRQTPARGQVTGSGAFDFAAANGFGIDLRIAGARTPR